MLTSAKYRLQTREASRSSRTKMHDCVFIFAGQNMRADMSRGDMLVAAE